MDIAKTSFGRKFAPLFFVGVTTPPPPHCSGLASDSRNNDPCTGKEKGQTFPGISTKRRREGGGATNYRISNPPDSKFGGLLPSAKVRATSKLYSSLTFVGLSIFIHDFISTGGSGHMCGPEYATSSRPGLWGCKKGQQSFIVTHPLHHFDLSEYTYAPPG